MTSKLPKNCDYEITTSLSLDSLSTKDAQEITNKLSSNGKRESITNDNDNQLMITRATGQNINDADSILGNINAVSDEITIRIYNCSDAQINEINKNFDVINVRNFEVV